VTTFVAWLRDNRRLALALGATLALLLAHASVYTFLTDDAYISFRYARNLADGHGLVFNPGFEAVEGYTNFLWVLLLALAHVLGAPLPTASIVLSLSATVGLWAAVVALAWRTTPPERAAWVVLPPLLLALTRSVAVWSTSGLETRLFELFVVAGVLRLLIENDRLARGSGGVRPFAALLFALTTLTRPDGLLVSLAALSTVALTRGLTPRRGQTSAPAAGRATGSDPAAGSDPGLWRWLAGSAVTFACVVGGHLLFRRAYYGDWVPNTYHAKVGGRLWWSAGLQYVACFALEYGLVFWLPFLVAAVVWHRRRGSLVVPAVYAAVVLPHVAYIASIGGDHFEYRPLDLYLPFVFLAVQSGALWLARGGRATAATLAAAGVVAALAADLPRAAHVQFPERYAPGFPGMTLAEHDSLWIWPMVGEAERYLDPDRALLHRLPGLRSIAEAHRALLRSGTARFVGIRQEEHRLFLAGATAEARTLEALVATGRLPRDTYVAIDCVGAIPYYSNLRTLDRLGLTEAAVARGQFVNPEVMAHGKYTTEEHARRRQVDLWALDAVYLTQDVRQPNFLDLLLNRHVVGGAHYADIGGGRYLVVAFPNGVEQATRRFPALGFRNVRDPALVRELVALALPHYLAEIERYPGLATAHAFAAGAWTHLGRPEEAEKHYRRTIELDPTHTAAHNNLAAMLVSRGALADAAALLRAALRTTPDNVDLRVNLGRVLLGLGDADGAREQFEAALRLEPERAGLQQLLQPRAGDSKR
jgi:tetratricopeptide (TPR) repeat protein